MTEHSTVTLETATAVPLPDAQTVTEVEHYTDSLFRFRVTRPASLRFRSGEFVMIGLMGNPHPETGKQKPLLRAYSIASPAWDDTLQFYSIKVDNGPLTNRLQHIKVGDQVILKPKSVGTLVHDALTPANRIWFFSTGTGIAPFASLLREPETYERFDQVILTHTCRDVADLKFGKELIAQTKTDILVGEEAQQKLHYYPTTTRETSKKMGRITSLLEDGSLLVDLGVTDFNATNDRAMVCGSIDLNSDMKRILENYGLREGANSDPGDYVIEKAFVG
ncbi:MAG: ferredoxin--NADP reductase [Rhodobacterales bacterium]|jgi:ferredoxin--NADP+ reductase|uniref:ferredoxin--NADP reductase n=1 Tax=uncultured Planktomarina sp. TaxID=1538529 RepID=UPI003261348C|tara:strand:+ start:6087 stop:6920 length:834 start_codon:yes stop_codon:yes gene_type:complete